MYVCNMCVYIYVCVNLCMFVGTNYVRMYDCMYKCMYVCMSA